MIITEFPNADFSNGYAVGYLYEEGTALTFDFTSDRATTATLWLRLTCEFANQTLTDEMYKVLVNGTAQKFNPIVMILSPLGFPYANPCQDYLGITIQLNAGDNRIQLITTNDMMLAGTMSSNAPIVDCIKIRTDAELNMFTIDSVGPTAGTRREGPKYSNLEHILGPNWWLE